jgi:hypothetical protein
VTGLTLEEIGEAIKRECEGPLGFDCMDAAELLEVILSMIEDGTLQELIR